MSFVQNNYVHAPVVGPAFLRVVGVHGPGIGVTRYRETLLVRAEIGQVMEHVVRPGRGKLPVAGPLGRVGGAVVRMPLDPEPAAGEFPVRQKLRDPEKGIPRFVKVELRARFLKKGVGGEGNDLV